MQGWEEAARVKRGQTSDCALRVPHTKRTHNVARGCTHSDTHAHARSHSLTRSLKCCAHPQCTRTRQHNTKLPRVRGAAVSLARCCRDKAVCLPFLRPRRYAVDGKAKGIFSLLCSQDFLRMYVFEYIFIVFFLFFFVTESCGQLGILVPV